MKSLIFVGGFSKTINTFELSGDLESSDITLNHLQSFEVDENPSFMDISGDRLYCVHEVGNYKGQKSGGLSLLKIKSSIISRCHSQYSSGKGPTHIKIDEKHNCVYVCNYESGHFSVIKLKDTGFFGGSLYIENYEGRGHVPKVQDSSHPHGAFTKHRFVYVVDLGCDKIWHYERGHSGFQPSSPDCTRTRVGTGPRHMAFHPHLNLAFLVTELSQEIIVYKFVEKNGALLELYTYKYLSDDVTKNYGAEIMVHPNGQYVYLSNRGNGCIISYRIVTENGELEKIESFSLKGTWPRHFNIHSSGKLLICADQLEGHLELLLIDDKNGKLEFIDTIKCDNKPSCVVFKDLH